MEVFPRSGSLELVAIDFLETLSKTKERNPFVVEKTHRYKRLTKTIPMPRVTAPLVALLVSKHWIIPDGLPNTINE